MLTRNKRWNKNREIYSSTCLRNWYWRIHGFCNAELKIPYHQILFFLSFYEHIFYKKPWSNNCALAEVWSTRDLKRNILLITSNSFFFLTRYFGDFWCIKGEIRLFTYLPSIAVFFQNEFVRKSPIKLKNIILHHMNNTLRIIIFK